jgi:hypothetical protein
MCCLPEVLFYSRICFRSIYTGYWAYLLDSGIVEGALVGRGYIFSRRQDYEAKGHKEGRRAHTPRLYLTLISPRTYNSCWCLGSH